MNPALDTIVGSAGSFSPRGPIAREIADLWWLLLILGGVVTIGVLIFLLVALIRKTQPESAETDAIITRRWIIGGGAIIPAIVLAIVFGFSLSSMSTLPNEAPEDALVVEVVGHQWWWQVSYEGYQLETANEVHIPVDEPIAIRLRSADVIHSFWVPELAGKMDALPDGVNTLVLEADEPGSYGGRCAEFCGIQHAKMGILVVAVPEAEFAGWLESQEQPMEEIPEDGAARRGFDVFMSSGCAECHTIRGTDAAGERGPDLTHVATRKTLAATSLQNTTENLIHWVGNPQEVKEGSLMPDVELSDQELEELVAFLESLR